MLRLLIMDMERNTDKQMDFKNEAIFLQLLSERRDVLNNKCRNKELNQQKEKMWEEIQQKLMIETGRNFTVHYIRIKWNNIQERVKEKSRCLRQSGAAGGRDRQLTDNDKQALMIIGQDNPKLAWVPGSIDSLTGLNVSTLMKPESEEAELDPGLTDLE